MRCWSLLTYPLPLAHGVRVFHAEFLVYNISDAAYSYINCSSEAPFVELHHTALKQLHTAFVTGWGPWVAASPASWRADGWLESHRPISVCCRYGQNQAVANPNTIAQDARAWGEERDYNNIRTLTMALATHLR